MSLWFVSLVAFYCATFCDGYLQMPPPLPGTNTYQLRMPGVVPERDDDYICTAFKLDPEKEMYITQFRVEGTAERAHHMILSGCAGVFTSSPDTPSWNCGSHATCTGSTRILYAWAKNAAGTRLPPSVGFRIGGTGKSRVKYLVVQVHYATKLPPGERDYTGLDLEITFEPQKYIAGILLMVASPEIPPHQAVVNSDSCCPLDSTVPINVFATRVHAHALGTVITAYKYDPKTHGTELMIKGNPQWPQAFYPTTREFSVAKGDEILIRCTYSSLGKDTYTRSGGSGADEMCNVYMMYYTDADNGTEFQSCGYVCNPEQNKAYPADSIEPPPRNPVLEAYAIHGKRNHQLRKNSSDVQDHPEIITQKRKGDAAEQKANVDQSFSPQVAVAAAVAQEVDNQRQVVNVDKETTSSSKSSQVADDNEKAIRQQKQREDNFWSFLFFYRRFLS
uniref:peptidylglycine monooxygenase n=1 Tax=Daphnia magna TaxID=35525 RepID=A0A0P6GTR0_9CRUS